MTGMNLSFRVEQAGCLKAMFLVLICLLLLAPASYGAWWIGGGQEIERKWRLQWLTSGNPLQDAREAANDGDYRTIALFGAANQSLPAGVRMPPQGQPPRKYDYWTVGLFKDKPLTQSQKQLNQKVISYAKQYNAMIRKLRP